MIPQRLTQLRSAGPSVPRAGRPHLDYCLRASDTAARGERFSGSARLAEKAPAAAGSARSLESQVQYKLRSDNLGFLTAIEVRSDAGPDGDAEQGRNAYVGDRVARPSATSEEY